MATVSLTPQAMDLAIFGDQGATFTNYLETQMHRLQAAGTSVGSRVLSTLQNSYNYVTDTLRNYRLREELEREGILEFENYFRRLTTYDELRGANITMQRWIMAHPKIKELYLRDDCYGYPNTYTNISGDTFGEDDYDYRRVMNGMVVPHENGIDASSFEYHEELIEGDRELTAYEQGIILDTWDGIRNHMANSKLDFTANTNMEREFNL